MFEILLTLAVSGGIVVLLTLLFHIEKKRQRRFFPRVRAALDHGVERAYRSIGSFTRHLGRDAVRHTAHYLFHRFLKMMLELFRTLERKTDKLLRVNKELAKRAIRKESATPSESMLKEVAAHKADTALTPKEKKIRKEKSIGTKL
jgi:hypothetical protein